MTTSMINRAAILSVLLMLLSSSAFAAGDTAKLSGVKGKVEVMSGASWTVAKNGDTVSTNAKLRTGPDGSCMVTWGGGHAFKMAPGTLVAINDLSTDGNKETSSLNLTSGKLFAKARKMGAVGSTFSIRTPTAVAGVRGTEVAVGVVNNVSTVQVTEGLVGVSLPGGEPTLVEPGFEVSVPEGMTNIPVPEPIPTIELQDLKQNMQEVKSEADATTPPSSSNGNSKDESKSPDKETTKDTTVTETKAPDTSTADSSLNSVNQALQNNAILDVTQAATKAAMDSGTVQIDIYIVKP